MGSSQSTGRKTVFASMCEDFVEETDHGDVLIPIRSIHQSLKISTMTVIIKSVRPKSDKVALKAYEFKLSDILEAEGKPLEIQQSSRILYKEWRPSHIVKVGVSSGVKGFGSSVKSSVSRAENTSFSLSNVTKEELCTKDLLEILSKRKINLKHHIVKSAQRMPGACICVVKAKIFTGDDGKIMEADTTGVAASVTAKPSVATEVAVGVSASSSNSITIGILAGTCIAYSVWELQINTKDGTVVPVIFDQSGGGFVEENSTEDESRKMPATANNLGNLSKKDIDDMKTLLRPLLELPSDAKADIRNHFTQTLEVPRDAKILDDIIDAVIDNLENADVESDDFIDLEDEGILHIQTCLEFLLKIGFHQKKKNFFQDPSVVEVPSNSSPVLEAFDYIYNIVGQMREAIIAAVVKCEPHNAKAIINTVEGHFGEDVSQGDRKLEIFDDQAASCLALAMGLKYDIEKKILIFPETFSRISFRIFNVLYAIYGNT